MVRSGEIAAGDFVAGAGNVNGATAGPQPRLERNERRLRSSDGSFYFPVGAALAPLACFLFSGDAVRAFIAFARGAHQPGR